MIVTRECDSSKGCVENIRKVCHLVGRCDGHGGDVRRLMGGVTVVRKCGVSSIRKVCQLMERCDGNGVM